MPHRVEPALAIEVLELESGANYAPTYAQETRWSPSFATRSLYEDARAGLPIDWRIDDAREVVEVASGVRIYVKDGRCVLLAEREHFIEGPLVVDGIGWFDQHVRPGTYVYHPRSETYVV